MEAHQSFRISERLAPLAIISSVRSSAANRDSACDAVLVFDRCLDSDPARPHYACGVAELCFLVRSESQVRGIHNVHHVDPGL